MKVLTTLKHSLAAFSAVLLLGLTTGGAEASTVQLSPMLLTAGNLGPDWVEAPTCAATDNWQAQHALGASSGAATCLTNNTLVLEEFVSTWPGAAAANAARQSFLGTLQTDAPNGAQVPLSNPPGAVGWEAPCYSIAAAAPGGAGLCPANGFFQLAAATRGSVLVSVDIYPTSTPGTAALANYMTQAVAKVNSAPPGTRTRSKLVQPLIFSLKPYPPQLGRHGGVVHVIGTLTNGKTCQLRMLSHQGFPVVYANNVRPCVNRFSATVVVGANPTAITKTIAFSLAVRNGTKLFTARVFIAIAS